MTLMFIMPDILLRFMFGMSLDFIEDAIQDPDVSLVTSTFAFYEAMCCMTAGEIELNAKYIEQTIQRVSITSMNPVGVKVPSTMNEERKQRIRRIALKEDLDIKKGMQEKG